MNRRAFFATLLAPVAARVFPKPEPQVLSLEDFCEWFNLQYGEQLRLMAEAVDRQVMESMVYGTGWIRVEDFTPHAPIRIGSDFTDAKRRLL